MRIRVICIGRLKERFYTDAVAEFTKRLSRFCDVEIVDLPDEKVADSPSEAEIERVKGIECQRLEARLAREEYVIALDPRGRELSSEQLADKLSEIMLSGGSRIAFIIGGSHGLTDALRRRADFVLSFSKMTFSHQIFRTMLLEQVYRAFKIINNEPYHK